MTDDPQQGADEGPPQSADGEPAAEEAPEPEIAIEVVDLVKSFGEVKVLKGVSFKVRAGETVCILGGSGGGKSTLLKTMIGAHPATSGSIRFGEEDVASARGADLDRIRRKFGVMFQGGALLNSMTVGENVALPLEFHTQLDPDTMSTMVTMKLMQVDMLHAEHRAPSAISGGMQKRAAVARALALDPKILFYDEPSAGLDPIATTMVDNLITALKESMDMTNVVVTHVMESVDRIADHIIFLKEGRVHFDGSLDEFKASQDEDIQRFLKAEVEDEDVGDHDEFYAQLMQSEETVPVGAGSKVLGWIGHSAFGRLQGGITFLTTLAGMWALLRASGKLSIAEPFRGKRNRARLRALVGPLLEEVGNRSMAIVALVSLLMGAILIFQTGDVLQEYGQIAQAPSMVAFSMTRELGPLMTAFIMTARVGASYTAVLAAMKLNEEILALETMAIDPVAYLVSPRLIAMLIMLPILTMISYFAGITGGMLIGYLKYDLSFGFYLDKTLAALTRTDLISGLVKGFVFGGLTSIICCYYGMNTRGGPMGLGRFTTLAVVTSMVVVVISDAILTTFFVTYKALLEGWFG